MLVRVFDRILLASNREMELGGRKLVERRRERGKFSRKGREREIEKDGEGQRNYK